VNSVKKTKRPIKERTCSRFVCRFCELLANEFRPRHHLIAMAVEKPIQSPNRPIKRIPYERLRDWTMPNRQAELRPEQKNKKWKRSSLVYKTTKLVKSQ